MSSLDVPRPRVQTICKVETCSMVADKHGPVIEVVVRCGLAALQHTRYEGIVARGMDGCVNLAQYALGLEPNSPGPNR